MKKFDRHRGIEKTLLYTDESGGELWQGNRHDVADIKTIQYSMVILAAYDFQPRILTPEQFKTAPVVPPYELDLFGDSEQDIVTEFQPPQIVRIPMVEPDVEEASTYLHMIRSPAYAVAHQAVCEIRNGNPVLSSCWAGLNRSSFISASILWLLKQGSMDEIIERLTKERCFGCPGLKLILSECAERWQLDQDYRKSKLEKQEEKT